MIGSKRFTKICLVFMFMLILTPGLFAQEIRVTSPNGSEEFNCGQRISIRWTSSGAGNIVKIGFTRGSEIATPLITTRAPNKGVFNYTIPSNFPPGTNYKIGVANADETVHDRSDNFFRIVCKPEVKATVATITPVPRAMGDTVTYEVEIKNTGAASTSPWKAELHVIGPAGFTPLMWTYNFNPIPRGHSFKISKTYVCPRKGTYTNTLKLDTGNDITEFDETNNTHTKNYVVDPLPDLMVCVEAYKRVLLTHKQAVFATVKNIGPETSKPCVLRFYIGSKGAETYDIPALDTNQQHQIKRDERYYTAGRKKIECIIDYGNNLKEVNEKNNQIESSIYVRLPHEDTYVVKPYNQKCSDGTEIK